MSEKDWTSGPGGAHGGYRFDWAEATRKADEFKAAERQKHQARIAARAEDRKAKKQAGLEVGEYGPPNPWKFRKGRPKFKEGR